MKHQPRLLSNGRAHGWIPDHPDPVNDWHLSKLLGTKIKAKTAESPKLNSTFYSRVGDQGQLGACTGWAARACLSYKMREKHGDKLAGKWGQGWDLSPLAIYWLGRQEENCIQDDTGCQIRDVIDAVRKSGAPTEASWPYVQKRFRIQPSAAAMKTATWHKAAPASYRCDGKTGDETVSNMLAALAAGLPIDFGFTCYDNLGDADATGLVPMPKPGSNVEGGHSTAIFEADTPSRVFKFQNSWTEDWGDKGWGYIPFDFFVQGLADDVWAVDLA